MANQRDNYKTRIKYLRENRSLTQKELADAIGISRSQLSHFELGIAAPNVDVLISLANYFHVSVDYLLGLTSLRTSRQSLERKIDRLSSKSVDVLEAVLDALYLKDMAQNTK